MVPLLLSLALAGPAVFDFDSAVVSGELLRPEGEMVFARVDAPMSEDEARKIVRKGKRRPPTDPAERMRLADALQVQRHAAFLALAARMDAGEDEDIDTLRPYDEQARELYLDAAPGLPDDHAARALVLAARIGEDLGRDPRPELESALELDPTGPYAEQVRLQLAELDFDASNLVAAARGYESVRQRGGKFASYAAYKLAWCRYNTGELGRAIGLIVPLAHDEGPLASQARKDAVRFAGELERPEAYAVVGKLCAGDEACMEASRIRLEGLWKDVGR